MYALDIRLHSRGRWLLLLVFCLSPVGCGSSGDQTETFSVQGQVTLDGKPLPQASVLFLPTSGHSSAGTTDAEGRYSLIYDRDQTGAVPGTHQVQITAMETVPGQLDSEGQPVHRQILPPRYNAKTTLSAQISADSDAVDFALTSQK